MNKKAFTAIFLLLAASLLFGQGSIKFKDDRGISISLPRKATRIVSLSPELTEILFAIGAGDTVVGVTTYCNYPKEALSITKIGGFSAKTISIESIIALKPDVIVGNINTHQLLIPSFEKAGLQFVAAENSGIVSVFNNISLFGMISGNEAKAEALNAELKKRFDAVKAKTSSIKEDQKPVVFWETWDEPLMSAGPKSFTGELIVAAGGRNAFYDASQDWPIVSFEAVLARNPDWIMAPDTHGEALTIERLSKRPGWGTLKAVKAKQIYLMDGDLAARACPRFIEAVETMAKILYPNLYK